MSANSRRLQVAFLLTAITAGFANAVLASPLEDARQLYLTGRYEEAAEIYQMQQRRSSEATLGLARCQAAHGEYEAALRILGSRWDSDADPGISAEMLLLKSEHQPYAFVTRNHVDFLVDDNDSPASLWAKAQWRQATGKSNETHSIYRRLVDYYRDSEKIDDPDTLRYIGLAAAEQARRDGDAEQFRFLVNTLYPQALALEKNYWPAHLDAGLLFLEKYNLREATAQLNKALAINPNAAEVHAARAALAMQSFDLDRARTSIARALELNPHLREALQLKADLLMADFRVQEAIDLLKTEAMPLYAHHPDVRGRLAAAYGYVDGLNRSEEELYGSRMQQMVFESITMNDNSATLFRTMGDTFDLLRKYPHAAQWYRQSHQADAKLIDVPGKLGMVEMRLGNEAPAKKLLEHSFDVDPFNVRVKNSLEVLDVLDNYAVLETEHFVIKFDRGQDQMLAEYAARYLEDEVYPQIVADFGYEPKQKTLFEIFSRAKNTSGHGWFSARMVGLPYIGTVGACAGQMVAIASPNDMPEPYNWARVLKHEFVHVVNLQQTDFNIPHWFTEGLAVRSEGYPRPPDWTQLLARRHADQTLFTLDDINHGFLRPGAGDDWTLAYCQAEVYAEYMVARFGDDALAKMLAAYADNLSTREAIQRSFELTQVEFEEGYRAYVTKLVEGISNTVSNAPNSITELQGAATENPDDAEILAALSHALLERKSNSDARRYALAALKLDEQQQLAAYVMARLYLSIGDSATALKYLRESFVQANPEPKHLALLAGMLLRGKKFAEAEKLYALGANVFPHDSAWQKRLATVYLQTKNNEQLVDVLAQLALLETDSVAFRTKLAQLAMARKDYDDAERWAMEALQINLKDAQLHVLRAAALAAQKRPTDAAQEYGYALRLNPDELNWRLSLAKALAAGGDDVQARLEIEKILRRNPDIAGAKELLDSLKRE